MNRVLAIWLPRWREQRRMWGPPDLPFSGSLPFVGKAGEGEAVGDRFPHDRAALTALAQWCCRYAPTVGFEEGDAPETLLADATNLAPLYGGEERLIEQVARGLKRQKLDARLAVADTIGAAWALAHCGGASLSPGLRPGVKNNKNDRQQRDSQAEPGAGQFTLSQLPLAALRLDDDLLATLQSLGVRQIGEVLLWPREQLRSRFGPSLLWRIDQFTGAAREVILAVPPPEEFVVEQELEFPLADRQALAQVMEALARRLASLLAARCAGALGVVCQVECDDASAVEFEVGLFQPSANLRHLLALLELELERVRFAAPATAIALRVIRQAPLVERQGSLFDEERSLDGSTKLAALVDQFAGRLGRRAVLRCALASEAQPELAYRAEPLIGKARARARGKSPAAAPRTAETVKKSLRTNTASKEGRGGALRPLDRPTHLLPTPTPVETIAVAPGGPPRQFCHAGRRQEIVRTWGPERIETGWWRRRTAARDYYRVETDEGSEFWLFRELRSGQWFLHGMFE